MNIYIYGSSAFKKKIHYILDRGNIRFKIDDGKVEDIVLLGMLKDLIEKDPHQIFLIEQAKIIENDFVKKYLKFLIPKDGIEKEFLDKYGVGDISLRDYTDLIIYLERRIESAVKIRPKAEEINSIDEIFEVFEDIQSNEKSD